MVMKKKNRKIMVIVAILLAAVLVVGGVVIYKNKNQCVPTSDSYPMCQGGCFDPGYYKQHIDLCNNV
ncbi:MAG TPA: hypothetical protein VLG47_07940 [Candidatus Saccharimonadales bacterium]|nr:hypothetical protein [Candidatus Saccharimonadales bacterium]